MSILSNLFFGNPKVIVGSTETELQRMTDYLNFTTNNFTIEQGENISSVYTACKILAEDVGSFPLNLYQDEPDGAKRKIKDDLRYTLLHHNPNGYTTSNIFFQTLEYIRNVKGNSFAKIERDNDGFVIALTALLPWQVSTYKIVNGELFYYYKKDYETNSEWVSGREFLHFKAITIDCVWGMNPIEKMRLNLSLQYKGLTTMDKFYDNNATSPKALKTTIPEGINPKEWQAKVADFTEKYGGFKNAGKVISLPPFTELQDIALSFADAEFIATLRYNSDQIAALYKVPPHMLGNFESSKFNNLELLQLNYKSNTLRPILRMYRQEMETKLLTKSEIDNGMSIEFNTDALVEVDSKTRIENLKTLFSLGVVTPNEIAKHEGHPTFTEGGDDHYMLTQLMSVEKYNANKPSAKLPVAPNTDTPIV
jgi:HK97 family phage portal protein